MHLRFHFKVHLNSLPQLLPWHSNHHLSSSATYIFFHLSSDTDKTSHYSPAFKNRTPPPPMDLSALLMIFTLPCLSLIHLSSQTPLQNQSQLFTLMKASLSGPSLLKWDTQDQAESYCNYTGIACDTTGYVVEIDITSWSLSGCIPNNICSYTQNLRVLRLAHNNLHGEFPTGILNCTYLEELNLSSSKLVGPLPDLSPLKSLRVLDLSINFFSGEFPLSVTNLTRLEKLHFLENGGFSKWELSDKFIQLTNLKRMILTTCSLHGPIPPWVGNMTSLVDLELSSNSLIRGIPVELSKLKNLQFLELFNNKLTGEIPEELSNLTQLADLDISGNQLEGKIPESICRLPNLRVLQLYNNSLSGEIPPVIGNSTSLQILSLYENFLEGQLPQSLGKFSDLIGLDVSENLLSGELPKHGCKNGKLLYFCALQNKFTGGLPGGYANCKPLLRFRVSYNRLSGPIPEGLLGLPHVSIIDLSFNHFNGVFPKSMGSAKNLSELYIQSNRISGSLPSEISQAINLVKIELSNNLLSGPIPSEIGNLKKLNILLLQENRLESSIPSSLSSLKSLNLLNLSNNLLSGNIPESLCELLPNSLDFSNNHLSGPIPLPLVKEGLVESFSGNPNLCVPVYFNSSIPSLPLCLHPQIRKRLNTIWVVAIPAVVLIVGLLLFLRRRCSRGKVVEQNDFFTSSFTYEMTRFRKLNFDQDEIVKALLDKNLVGYGGSGAVYKIELSSGQSFAVKKLWVKKTKDPCSDQPLLDRELKAEVETLGSIRHKNIVKLYCYFSNMDSNLLVYEYMPNGNLWDMLHQSKILLDWPTRHGIAVGIAQGLAYLHHDLMPPVIHRDIKSTNILLNADFEPKVADFGVAKVLQARGQDGSTTVIAGTYGYLAPEYAYSSKATIKCDVYSFGVVLMELITGKKPIEAEYGENKNIIFWISQKVATKEGIMEVLDRRLPGSFKNDMTQVLKIAIRCTCSMPALRPTMSEVVQLLIEADPCRFESFKSLDKQKEDSSTVSQARK